MRFSVNQSSWQDIQMSWMTLRILIAICLLHQTGCVQILNRIDDCAIKIQDKNTTNRAWSFHRGYWETESHQVDFRIGFKAGYFASLDGEECPPAVPPKFYWSAQNSGPDAQARTNAWFHGWWMGSAAATSDGLFDHREVQIAPRLQQRSKKSEIAWPESSSSAEDDFDLIPIPDVPTESEPGSRGKGDEIPFVPPAIDPLKTPDKKYSPDPKKKI